MVGVAEIKVVRKLAVAEIWERYSSVAFIDKPDFDAYFFWTRRRFCLGIWYCETVRISLEFS